jgi:hypothetical protein
MEDGAKSIRTLKHRHLTLEGESMNVDNSKGNGCSSKTN